MITPIVVPVRTGVSGHAINNICFGEKIGVSCLIVALFLLILFCGYECSIELCDTIFGKIIVWLITLLFACGTLCGLFSVWG